MVHALGYVLETFDPAAPGRLCRGRERWIEYDTMQPKDPPQPLHRLVITGARFSDDRARDARRGLGYGPISLEALFETLLGEGPIVAYCEEGHPQEVPVGAAGVEHHTVARPGGSLRDWRVRWHIQTTTADALKAAINAGADVFIQRTTPDVNPAATMHESPLIPPLADATDSQPSFFNEKLAQALFLITGFRAPGRPNRYFQPWGISAVLEHVDAVILFHRDKHGPALGFYANTAPDLDHTLSRFRASNEGALLVPFAIPPMLARWDRALWELRQMWDAETAGEFPVPAAARAEHEGPPPRQAPEPIIEPQVEQLEAQAGEE